MKHFSDEMVIMHLIKSYCQPLIIYACESFHLLRSEISHSSAGLGIAYFGVFLKLDLRIYKKKVKVAHTRSPSVGFRS